MIRYRIFKLKIEPVYVYLIKLRKRKLVVGHVQLLIARVAFLLTRAIRDHVEVDATMWHA